ncbi:MAG: hypothetical protein RIM99_20840 [Cyclobacteriaceae bacterium]
MNAGERNTVNSIKRLFIVVGLIVASLVIYQGKISKPIRDHSIVQNQVIGEQIKNKVMFLGQISRSIQNHFD